MEVEYSASILRSDQLQALKSFKLKRVFIPYDLFFIGQLDIKDIDSLHHDSKTEVFISMPRIVRKRDDEYLNSFKDFLKLGKADGVLIKNLDSLGYICSLKNDLESQYISINALVEGFTPLYVICDNSLYNWNISSLDFYRDYTYKQTVPFELSIHEIKELNDRDLICVIYGRAPLMVSANCIRKTTGNCSQNVSGCEFNLKLIDRKNKDSLVYNNCIHCYNEIYNSVPTSLHKYMLDLLKAGFHDFRLDFSDETRETISKILSYYITEQRSGSFPLDEYTAAHISKGAL